ncbi:MAG: purine-nucleoside phosphorylase [Kiritimatiellae bacterium]|nr:purine-nucleoside phosphorylase [Kiritimatiellia bacterium]
MNVEIFDRAAARVLPLAPHVDMALILGSGWSDAIVAHANFAVRARLPYSEIPGLGAAKVVGHAGELVIGEWNGATSLIPMTIAVWCGRRHYYEGEGWEAVLMPVELSRRMGGKRMLVTNASGGINPALRPGDFVVIKDHINTVGINPLIGPHNPAWGARFPDMSAVYTFYLRERLRAATEKTGLRAMEGVYAFTSGPVYETPAEVEGYKRAGADIVGMSTVPEAVFARACAIEVAGLSLVTNYASGIAPVPLSHEEVLAAAQTAKPRMAQILASFLDTFA